MGRGRKDPPSVRGDVDLLGSARQVNRTYDLARSQIHHRNYRRFLMAHHACRARFRDGQPVRVTRAGWDVVNDHLRLWVDDYDTVSRCAALHAREKEAGSRIVFHVVRGDEWMDIDDVNDGHGVNVDNRYLVRRFGP